MTEGLGTLNPNQALVNIFGCQIWVVYGCLSGNPYITLANVFGVVAAVYYLSSCIGIMSMSIGKKLSINQPPKQRY